MIYGRWSYRLRVLLPTVALMFSGISLAQPPSAAATLYDRLGGESGIENIVVEMLVRIADDERIAPIFAASNLTRLHMLLQEQICEVANGPCEYTGFSMEESHRGMAVTETEFNAVVEALILAMESLDVAVPVQNQLLARLAPMHADIVNR